jgi:hypothetical protein
MTLEKGINLIACALHCLIAVAVYERFPYEFTPADIEWLRKLRITT